MLLELLALGIVNGLEEVPARNSVGPVGHKPLGEEVLQTMTPISGRFAGSADRCDRIVGEALSAREGYRRLLEEIGETGQFSGDVGRHQSLHFDVERLVLYLKSLREPFDENLTNKDLKSREHLSDLSGHTLEAL